MEISREIDHRLYPREAINNARNAFRDFCDFKITPLGNYKILIRVKVRSKYQSQGREIILEFLNYLLDSSSELYFNKE